MNNIVRDALLGVAVADALGVPVEFMSREELAKNPVMGMRAYGTYNQPAGTWSDDSSLTFCLADSLSNGYNLKDIAKKFINWRDKAIWTAHNEVFDIGNTTNSSIELLKDILTNKNEEQLKILKLYADEYSNGNGSLMRILPLIFYIKGKPINEQFDIIWETSALTHGHVRSAIGCLIYLRIAEHLINKIPKERAYFKMQKEILEFLNNNSEVSEDEIKIFNRIIYKNISDFSVHQIQSSGYVVHSLEASLWCLLRNKTYSETVLEAVNLGYDTDTTGAIVGGLSGILYGEENIPKSWRETLVGEKKIIILANKLHEKFTRYTRNK